MKKGLLLVISGPSGAGKGTVIGELLSKEDSVCVSISCTTRAPRPGEVDGEHYHFVSREEFEAMLERGEFLEYAKVFDNYYGTPFYAVEEKRDAGKNVILEIDVQGAMNVKKKVEDAVSIFILPPSMEELKRRLTGRGTESEEQIEKRTAGAYEEMKYADRYDYRVVNEEIDKTADEIMDIIRREYEKIGVEE